MIHNYGHAYSCMESDARWCFEGFMIQSVCNSDIHEYISSFADQICALFATLKDREEIL